MTIQANRKDDHVGLATQQYQITGADDFQQTHFVHHSLPAMDCQEVGLETSMAGFPLTCPIYINAITGGSPQTQKINQRLAILANETGLALSSGSVSIALTDDSAKESFTILRKEALHAPIFANLGAHHSLENAKRAVDLMQADGIQLHLNAPQELIMPEGDRSFHSWLTNIESIVRGIDCPVIVKEVGFGMSRETIQALAEVGVRTIDVSGKGGTNFATIENARRKNFSYDYLSGWGQSTLVSLLEAGSIQNEHSLELLASGGVKSPLDVVKCLALGANAVGLSGFFLELVRSPHSIEDAIRITEEWKEQLKAIMTLLGCRSVSDLQNTDIILAPAVQNWCQARGINWQQYANRRKLK